jgi:hypothetical protein
MVSITVMKLMKCLALASLATLIIVPLCAHAATESDTSSNLEGTFDSSIVPATDLLLNGAISTTAGPDLGFTLSGVNDGAASSNGNGGSHDTYFGNGDIGSTSLASNPTITIALNTSATGSTTGFTLNTITTINGWQNYDDSFSDQAYSVYYSTVSAPTTFSLLASVNYHPFAADGPGAGGGGGANSSMVVLTLDPTEAVGVADLEFILTPSFGPSATDMGTDAQGGSVIREFEATGIPTVIPEPSTYALLFGGLGLLVLVSRFRRKLTAMVSLFLIASVGAQAQIFFQAPVGIDTTS